MEIKSLRCNHCGANLKIDPKIKFFSCVHCGSSLTTKESGNALYTQVVEAIKDNTVTLIDNSNRLLKEQEIERLDREWLLNREKYKIHGSKGETHYPDEKSGGSNAIAVLVSLVIFIFIIGAFMSSGNSRKSSRSSYPSVTIDGKKLPKSHPLYKKHFPSSRRSPSGPGVGFAIVMFVIIIAIIFGIVSSSNKSADYTTAKEEYLAKRKKLLKELDDL